MECVRTSGHKLPQDSRVGAELRGLGRVLGVTWGGATKPVSVAMTTVDGWQKTPWMGDSTAGDPTSSAVKCHVSLAGCC